MTAAKVEKVAREMGKIIHPLYNPDTHGDCRVCMELARWHLREIARAERRGAEKAMHARIRIGAYSPTATTSASEVTVKVGKGMKR